MPKKLRNEIAINSKCYTKQCVHCTTTFFSTKPFTKYCSDKCRVYYNQAEKLRKASSKDWALKILKDVNTQVRELLQNSSGSDGDMDKLAAIFTKGTRKLSAGKKANL